MWFYISIYVFPDVFLQRSEGKSILNIDNINDRMLKKCGSSFVAFKVSSIFQRFSQFLLTYICANLEPN